MADRNNDIVRLSRGFGGSKTRDVVIAAARAGMRFRQTRKGLMFYGKDGRTVTIHYTESDHRAVKNTIARLRAIGYNPPQKGQRSERS
jgi:hypothetical protein